MTVLILLAGFGLILFVIGTLIYVLPPTSIFAYSSLISTFVTHAGIIITSFSEIMVFKAPKAKGKKKRSFQLKENMNEEKNENNIEVYQEGISKQFYTHTMKSEEEEMRSGHHKKFKKPIRKKCNFSRVPDLILEGFSGWVKSGRVQSVDLPEFSGWVGCLVSFGWVLMEGFLLLFFFWVPKLFIFKKFKKIKKNTKKKIKNFKVQIGFSFY
jgi:hypothetical protein